MLSPFSSIQKLLSSHPLSGRLKISCDFSRVMDGCKTWSDIRKEKDRLRIFENRVLQKYMDVNQRRKERWSKLHKAYSYLILSVGSVGMLYTAYRHSMYVQHIVILSKEYHYFSPINFEKFPNWGKEFHLFILSNKFLEELGNTKLWISSSFLSHSSFQ